MSKKAAELAYEEAQVGPEDVQVIELHDCFSANELITYEALGLAAEGEGHKLVEAQATTYGGDGPVVNPSGGLISKGHPLGATGLAQCSELTWQLRGQADKRQVDDVKVALQHNIGLGGAARRSSGVRLLAYWMARAVARSIRSTSTTTTWRRRTLASQASTAAPSSSTASSSRYCAVRADEGEDEERHDDDDDPGALVELGHREDHDDHGADHRGDAIDGDRLAPVLLAVAPGGASPCPPRPW